MKRKTALRFLRHLQIFSAVREALENEGITMVQAEVTMIPQTYVNLTDENDLKMMNRIIDLLDEDDDVQEVYHNAEGLLE